MGFEPGSDKRLGLQSARSTICAILLVNVCICMVENDEKHLKWASEGLHLIQRICYINKTCVLTLSAPPKDLEGSFTWSGKRGVFTIEIVVNLEVAFRQKNLR